MSTAKQWYKHIIVQEDIGNIASTSLSNETVAIQVDVVHHMGDIVRPQRSACFSCRPFTLHPLRSRNTRNARRTKNNHHCSPGSQRPPVVGEPLSEQMKRGGNPHLVCMGKPPRGPCPALRCWVFFHRMTVDVL